MPHLSIDPRVWLGMGGVAPQDGPAAHRWERRLHWIMVGVALLSLPSIYFEEFEGQRRFLALGRTLDAFIFAAFLAELAWMLRVSSERWHYLGRNWLNLLIVIAAGANLAGASSEWVALARLLRVTLVGLILARVAGSLGNLFSPRGVPHVLGVGVITMLVAGGAFYWLEPTVRSFGDGVWLAFVTGTTIGYGDFVPTTTASRIFAGIVVIVGFGILSIVIANFAALFLGEDERRLRNEMHRDIRELREQFQSALGEEERLLRREMRRDLRELREELAALRRELETGGLAERAPEKARLQKE